MVKADSINNISVNTKFQVNSASQGKRKTEPTSVALWGGKKVSPETPPAESKERETSYSSCCIPTRMIRGIISTGKTINTA